MIDGLEFLFSDDGTLKRLGQRTINNQAGFIALAHNRAEEAKIKPVVAIGFVQGNIVTDAIRPATGSKRPRPAIAATVGGCFVVDPIIRGHALRTFVETHTPEQRYTDVATWLQLGPLVEVQKNLRALRVLVKADAENTDPLKRINTALGKETGQAVAEWSDDAVVAHVNSTVLAPLDKTLAMKALNITDPAYVILVARVATEAQQVGLAGLQQIRQATAALWAESQHEETGEVVTSGAIWGPRFICREVSPPRSTKLSVGLPTRMLARSKCRRRRLQHCYAAMGWQCCTRTPSPMRRYCLFPTAPARYPNCWQVPHSPPI